MRRMFLGALLIFGVTVLQAQTFNQKLQAALQSGDLQTAQALRLEVLRVLAPDQLPPEFVGDDGPEKSSTGLMYRLRQAHARGLVGDDPLYKSLLSRPESDAYFISPGGWFRLHYDVTGYNAPDLTDTDQSGVPDYIESLAVIFDYVYEVEVNQLGYQPPPDDGNADGPEWDVYIRNLSNTYGWTNLDAELENQVWTSYIEMDNDYASTYTRGLDGAAVTAAHEFFHMIQLGYIGRDDDNDGSLDDLFLMEAGATWMEDVVYDDINDYYNYLPEFFRRDNVPFDYDLGLHMYGLALWFHFLEARLGSLDVGREVWESLVEVPALQSLNRVLLSHGSTMAQEMGLFHGWNYLTGSRADEVNCYPEGSHYPEFSLGTVQSFDKDTTFVSAIANKAVRYFRLSSDDAETVLAVTNAQWEAAAQSSDDVEIVLKDKAQSGYTDLGSGFYARVGTPNVGQWYAAGFTSESGMTFFSNTPDVQDEGETAPPFPNPFLPEEHLLSVILPEQDEAIHVTVYNTAGQRIISQKLAQGERLWTWDGMDSRGRRAASGVYVIFGQVGGHRIYREKVLLIR